MPRAGEALDRDHGRDEHPVTDTTTADRNRASIARARALADLLDHATTAAHDRAADLYRDDPVPPAVRYAARVLLARVDDLAFRQDADAAAVTATVDALAVLVAATVPLVVLPPTTDRQAAALDAAATTVAGTGMAPALVVAEAAHAARAASKLWHAIPAPVPHGRPQLAPANGHR